MKKSKHPKSNRYCFSLSTFSPTGELKQVEYANRCSSNGSPALGIKTQEGIVLVSEKKLISPLMIRDSYSKMEQIGSHAGITYAGLAPDFRVLVKVAQKAAVVYTTVHEGVVPVSCILSNISHNMQEFTQSCGVRPYGLSLLFAGWDRLGGRLYYLDASGSQEAVKVYAIGQDSSRRIFFLNKYYNPNLSLNEIVGLAIHAIHLGSAGNFRAENLEMAIVNRHGFKQLDTAMIEDFIDVIT